MPREPRKTTEKKLRSLAEWQPSTITRAVGSAYRQVVCPLCGRSASTKPIVKEQAFWERLAAFDPAKAFGSIQRAAGRGTLDVIGHFGPEGEPEIHAAIRDRIVAMLVEWLNKGWLTPENLLPVSSWSPGKPPKKPAPVAPVKAPIPTKPPGKPTPTPLTRMTPEMRRAEIAAAQARMEEAKPPVSEKGPSKAEELYEKWSKAKRPNAVRARTALEEIKDEYEVTDSLDLLDEYQGIMRSDYESGEEYAEARADAWSEFVESLQDIERFEEEGAPAKPPGKPTAKLLGKAKIPPPKRGVVQILPPAPAEGAGPPTPVGRYKKPTVAD